jgi:hypothetical protein
MADVMKIIELVKVGNDRIETQLDLASAKAADVSGDMWGLGYCFGIFDGLGSKARFDRDTDGLVLITVGLRRLFQDEELGAIHLSRVMKSPPEEFVQGSTLGAAEIVRWLGDLKRVPVGLCKRLMDRSLAHRRPGIGGTVSTFIASDWASRASVPRL